MPFALTSKLVSSFSAQLIYHAVLILRYTNSYTNALILLVRQHKTKPSIEIKEKVRIRAFTTFSSNAIIMHNYNSNETFDHTFSSKWFPTIILRCFTGKCVCKSIWRKICIFSEIWISILFSTMSELTLLWLTHPNAAFLYPLKTVFWCFQG